MHIEIQADMLIELGFNKKSANQLIEQINGACKNAVGSKQAWSIISKEILSHQYDFSIHLFLFHTLFPSWQQYPETAPAWVPTGELLSSSNISKFMAAHYTNSVSEFHQWTLKHYETFLKEIITELNIIFSKTPDTICDVSNPTSPIWFKGAKMNIIESCFQAPHTASALIYYDEHHRICRVSYGELNLLSNQIANSLIALGLQKGETIGIVLPMSAYAVALYLGIIKMGGVVVSIPDSFSSDEVAARLKIADAKLLFTQDYVLWDGKKIPIYAKITNLSLNIILLSYLINFKSPEDAPLPVSSLDLREGDHHWHDFLSPNKHFSAFKCDAMDPINILFSSGTTGEPKAIPWNHTTPIKVASDAFFHQNIQKGDVLAWPTNLGWMMGPWLVFAALINQGSIALFQDAPKDRAFGEFISKAKVTMFGVVPTLVNYWRQTKCLENLDFQFVKVLTSTGECSNPEDMLYMMSLVGYQPIIEYCGGTEIGGAYVSSTMVQDNYPSLFSTPTMGLNLVILDENGQIAKTGEVAIIPPAIGLSTTLLNKNHDEVYFSNMPKTESGIPLRRHGDQIRQLENGYYILLGRADDTMNLSGIKISAAEIERTLMSSSDVNELAAIAVPSNKTGPNLLVIYATTNHPVDKLELKSELQQIINTHLNPLFKISDVVLCSQLPKTASNKILRKELRKLYEKKLQAHL